MSRADVHVHSKYSDRPSEWILRRIGAPESFVEPLEIYQRARERGMDFVTISDHNRIEGALEIAHLPGTFLASEITTYFPEDGCKLHCLVFGFSPEQFAVIQELRENVYDFRDYLVEQNIVYSLAHPLFRVNDRLTVDHLEKILLLFNRFEGMNGTRDARACEMWNVVLRHLTPEMMETLADRHGMAPLGAEPWRKSFTAGSDDHSGIYIAAAHTITPPAATVGEFLAHLAAGRSEMGGTHGNSVRLAHCFYHIAYGYYKSRFLAGGDGRATVIGEMFRQLIERPAAQSWGAKAALVLANGAAQDSAATVERRLVEEFSDLLRQRRTGDTPSPQPPDAAADARTFHTACGVTQQLGYAFFDNLVEHVQRGEVLESLQNLASLGPVGLAIAPYLAAFHTQHKDEAFLQQVAEHFPAVGDRHQKSEQRAWVSDTFDDVNGVSRTIGAVGRAAQLVARPLTIVTCLAPAPQTELPLVNFTPIGSFPLPEYESQRVSVPPFLEIIEYFERKQFSEVIISTPGPLGLVALAAARLLGLRVAGIYHTDFPRYVRQFTEDENIEKLTWRYLHWFYGQLDCVFVPSECYRRQLTERGFPAERMRVLKRGVDLAQFDPALRQQGFWSQFGLGDQFTFLYVGRVSQEKNLPHLLDSFEQFLARGRQAQLAIVGDGPLLAELRSRYSASTIAFTGVLRGESLARAYASADTFVFPSLTDTFGNVVLEAQASGLPVIVGDQGGPPEIVGDTDSGLVVSMDRPGALAEALERLWSEGALRRQLRQRGLDNARRHRWETVLDDLWNGAASLAPGRPAGARKQTQTLPQLLASSLVGAGL